RGVRARVQPPARRRAADPRDVGQPGARVHGDAGHGRLGRGDQRGRPARGMSRMAEFVEDEQPLHPDYPLPDVDDPVMQPFWDGARAGGLMQQRDVTTGEVVWPPKPPYWKGGGRLEWFEARGTGRVHTWVVAHEPFLPAMRHLLPHIMVVVTLAEGPRIVGHMVRCPPEAMQFEMPVRVVFKRLSDRVTLPVWEPDR